MKKLKHPAIALGPPDMYGMVQIATISHKLPADAVQHDPKKYGLPSNFKDGIDHKINASYRVSVHVNNLKELSDRHPLAYHVMDHANLAKLVHRISAFILFCVCKVEK